MITGLNATRAITFLTRTISGLDMNENVPDYLKGCVPFELTDRSLVNQALRRIRSSYDLTTEADDRLPDVRTIHPWSDNVLKVPRSPSIMVVADGINDNIVECHVIAFLRAGDILVPTPVSGEMRWEEGVLSWALDQYVTAVRLCFDPRANAGLGGVACDLNVAGVEVGTTSYLRVVDDGSTIDASLAAAVADIQMNVALR